MNTTLAKYRYQLLKVPTKSTNSGLLVPKNYRPTDYQLGAATETLRKVVNQADGQWINFLPPDERQSNRFLETMACVTYGSLNIYEILFRVLYGINRNASDRFTAKVSGTSRVGNSLTNVQDAIRNQGLVDEAVYPWTVDVETWEQYYKDISLEILTLGLKDKQLWKYLSEWVYADGGIITTRNEEKIRLRQEALQWSPLGVTWRWQAANGDKITPRAFGPANHFTAMVGYKEGEYWEILDHYPPFRRKLAWDYEFPHAMRFDLLPRGVEYDQAKIQQLGVGNYLMRVKDKGQVYLIKPDTLEFLDSNKRPDGHVPLFDSFVRTLAANKKLIPVDEDTYNSLIIK